MSAYVCIHGEPSRTNKGIIKLAMDRGYNMMITMKKRARNYSYSESKAKKNRRDQTPQDIVIDVLTRLPAKSLIRFRCVCKTWSSLIRDPVFVKLHQTQSLTRPCSTGFLISSEKHPLDSYFIFADHQGKRAFNVEHTIRIPKSLSFVGIANGLSCNRNTDSESNLTDIFTVHNLSTHEITTAIPPAPRIMSCPRHFRHALFGFDPPANEYKIVRFCTQFRQQQIHIFSLGTKKWRKVNGEHHINFQEMGEVKAFKQPICVNGIIYWIVDNISLHSFDLHDEKFRQVAVPDPDRGYGLGNFPRLLQTGGRLTVLQSQYFVRRFEVDMNLKISLLEYHNKLWIPKKIGIPLTSQMIKDPIVAATIETGEILILDGVFSNILRLFYYNDESKKLRSEKIRIPAPIRNVTWKWNYDGGLPQFFSVDVFSFLHVDNILPLKIEQ